MIRTAFALALTAAVATAQDTSSLERLSSFDDVRDWQAVGRLELRDGGGYCTATMITRQHILTAAHCVLDRQTRRPMPASSLLFRAGLRDGAFLASRPAARVAYVEEYTRPGLDFVARVAFDIAVVELREPIADLGIVPFTEFGVPPEDGVVTVISYAEGREAAPSLQERCNIEDPDADQVLKFDCDLTFGASGSAVFTLVEGRPVVVTIVSGGRRRGGVSTVYGPRLDDRVEDLMADLTSENAARRLSAGQERRSLSDQLNRPDREPGRLPQIGQ
ncbi:MAG: trypsin-like peptidase domain-containing protein [Pseudomonadota bacterium]